MDVVVVDARDLNPVSYMVGSVLMSIVFTLLIGAVSLPAVGVAIAESELSLQLTIGVIVGYGIFLSQEFIVFDTESAQAAVEQSENRTAGTTLANFVLSVLFYTGAIYYTVEVLLTVGPGILASDQLLVGAAMLYPWWEKATVEAPVPVPLSYAGILVTVGRLTTAIGRLTTRLVKLPSQLNLGDKIVDWLHRGQEAPAGLLNLEQFRGSSG